MILIFKKEDIDHSNQILSHIIAMAKDIGMNCVAEDVETKKQLNTLHQYGCHIVQGFLFDRALPVNEFEKRLCSDYSSYSHGQEVTNV